MTKLPDHKTVGGSLSLIGMFLVHNLYLSIPIFALSFIILSKPRILKMVKPKKIDL